MVVSSIVAGGGRAVTRRATLRRRARGRAATAITALLTALLTATSTPAGASCDLVLTLDEVTQGVSQATLTNGEDTVFRYTASAPACTGGSSVTLRAASLRLFAGEQELTAAAQLPTPTFGAVSLNSRSVQSVTFNVLGTQMRPLSPQPFTLRAAVSADTSVGPRSSSHSIAVGGRTRPFSVLVVEMGDAARGVSLTTAERQALQQAIGVVERLTPSGSGVSSVASGTGGLRWQLAASMIDLGDGDITSLRLLDGDRTFCGKATNFEPIAQQLLKHRLAWNSMNATTPVDVAIGVVGASLSTGGNCALGYAQKPGSSSWATIVPDTDVRKSFSGGLSFQELAHNLDAVVDGGHTTSQTADPAGRAFNLHTNQLVPDSAPAMQAVVSYEDPKVFSEALDWQVLRCGLGASDAASVSVCPNPARWGVAAGSSAVQTLIHVRATTDGTPTGTELIAHTRESSHVTREPDGSAYELRLRRGTSADPGEIVRVHKLPVDGFDAHHDGSDEGRVEIDADFPFPASATVAELVHDGTVLGIRQIETVTVEAVQVYGTRWDVSPRFATSARERDPAYSADGTLIAYVEGSGLVVERADGSARSLPFTAEPVNGHPTIAPDNRSVVFECRSGRLCVVAFSPETMTFSASAQRVVLCPAQQVQLCLTEDVAPLTATAGGPSFVTDPTLPADEHFFVVRNGHDLWQVFPNRGLVDGTQLVVEARALTDTPAYEAEPAVGGARPAPGGGNTYRVAYRWSATAGDPSSTLRVLTIDGSEPDRAIGLADPSLTLTGPVHPSWGGSLIAFEGQLEGVRMLGVVHPDDRLPARVVTAGTRPSLLGDQGTTLAFVRDVGTIVPNEDIYVGTTRRHGRYVTVVGRTTGTAADARGFVLASHGGAHLPVASGLEPTAVFESPAPSRVVFTAPVPVDTVPAHATAVGAISSGLTWESATGDELDDRDKQRTVSILEPRRGGVWAQLDALPTRATGLDVEDFLAPAHEIELTLTIPGLGARDVGTAARRFVSPADLGLPAWPIGEYVLRATWRGSSTEVTFRVAEAVGVVDFDPDTLNLGSQGNPVTVYLTFPHATAPPGASARITSVGGRPYDVPDAYANALTWVVLPDGRAQAQFDRQALTTFIRDAQLPLDRVTNVTVRVRSPDLTFVGADPTAPYVQL